MHANVNILAFHILFTTITFFQGYHPIVVIKYFAKTHFVLAVYNIKINNFRKFKAFKLMIILPTVSSDTSSS